MWKFILRRLLVMIPQLFLLSIIVFMMAKAMPGDALSGQEINPRANPAELDRIREELGLNDPWYQQYLRWASNAVQGISVFPIHIKRPSWMLSKTGFGTRCSWRWSL